MTHIRDLFQIMIIIYNFYRFCLGITEAVLLSQNMNYQNECSYLWIQIIIECMINILFPLFMGCGTCILNQRSRSSDTDWRFNRFIMLSIIVGIWHQVTFFQISDSCLNFYKSNANNIWNLFMVEIVTFWVIVPIIIFLQLFKLININKWNLLWNIDPNYEHLISNNEAYKYMDNKYMDNKYMDNKQIDQIV